MIFIIFLPVGFSKLELILNEFFILFYFLYHRYANQKKEYSYE